MEEYEYKFFSDEDFLQNLLSFGPAVTNVDVTPEWVFYKGEFIDTC